MEEWLASPVKLPPQRIAFLAHSLASIDTFHKGQEWKYRKQILLCLHLYLLLRFFHLRSTDSTLFTLAKLRLHFFFPRKQEAVFIV